MSDQTTTPAQDEVEEMVALADVRKLMETAFGSFAQSTAQVLNQAVNALEYHRPRRLELPELNQQTILVEPVILEEKLAVLITALPVNIEDCYKLILRRLPEPTEPTPEGQVAPAKFDVLLFKEPIGDFAASQPAVARDLFQAEILRQAEHLPFGDVGFFYMSTVTVAVNPAAAPADTAQPDAPATLPITPDTGADAADLPTPEAPATVH